MLIMSGTLNGVTFLMIACKEVWPDSVKRLLEAGANPNIRHKMIGYPFHWLVYNAKLVAQRQKQQAHINTD